MKIRRQRKFSRREFLKRNAVWGAAFLLGGMSLKGPGKGAEEKKTSSAGTSLYPARYGRTLAG